MPCSVAPLRAFTFTLVSGALTACGSTEADDGGTSRIVSEYSLDDAIVDGSGNAFVVGLRRATPSKGSTYADPREVVRFSATKAGCGGSTPLDTSARGLWVDEGGFVMAVLDTQGQMIGHRRMTLDGAVGARLDGAAPPRPQGAGAPRSLDLQGLRYELGKDNVYVRRELPPDAVAANAIPLPGFDDAGRMYLVDVRAPEARKSPIGTKNTAYPTTPIDAEIVAFARDGSLSFRAGFAWYEGHLPTATVVPTGGVIVLDRNERLRRLAADGSTAWDVALTSGGKGHAHGAPLVAGDGSVTVTSFSGGYASIERHAPDGAPRWERTLDVKLGFSKVSLLNDGGVTVVGPFVEDRQSGVVRLRVDAAGAVLMRDTCLGAIESQAL